MESKQRELERNLTQEEDDLTQLKTDQRIKQRALEEVGKTSSYEQERQVEQLEAESNKKEEELLKIKRKIKERREAIAKGENAAESSLHNGRSEQLL